MQEKTNEKEKAIVESTTTLQTTTTDKSKIFKTATTKNGSSLSTF